MPRAKDAFKLDVTEATAGDTRTVTLTIQAPASDFLLADLLRQRGVVASIDATLKQAARDAVQQYLDSVEKLIEGVKKTNTGKAKAKATNGEENGTGEAAQTITEEAAQAGA